MAYLVFVLFLCVTSNAHSFTLDYSSLVLKSPKLRTYIVEATKNLTKDILKKYLFEHEEAMGRFGGKLEKIAERLLDQEIELIEKKMSEDGLEYFLTTPIGIDFVTPKTARKSEEETKLFSDFENSNYSPTEQSHKVPGTHLKVIISPVHRLTVQKGNSEPETTTHIEETSEDPFQFSQFTLKANETQSTHMPKEPEQAHLVKRANITSKPLFSKFLSTKAPNPKLPTTKPWNFQIGTTKILNSSLRNTTEVKTPKEALNISPENLKTQEFHKQLNEKTSEARTKFSLLENILKQLGKELAKAIQTLEDNPELTKELQKNLAQVENFSNKQ